MFCFFPSFLTTGSDHPCLIYFFFGSNLPEAISYGLSCVEAMFYVHVFTAYESGAVSPFQAFAAFIPLRSLRSSRLRSPSSSPFEAFVLTLGSLRPTLRSFRSLHPHTSMPSKPPPRAFEAFEASFVLSSKPFILTLRSKPRSLPPFSPPPFDPPLSKLRGLRTPFHRMVTGSPGSEWLAAIANRDLPKRWTQQRVRQSFEQDIVASPTLKRTNLGTGDFRRRILAALDVFRPLVEDVPPRRRSEFG